MSVAHSHVQQLAEIRSRILNLLLNDKDLVDTLHERPLRESAAEAEAHREQVAEIQRTLPLLHAADIADLLEALPEDERLALWRLIGNDRRGRVLVEASENVWESLIEEMSDRDLLRAIAPLDIDDQAYLAKYLSRDLTGRLLTSLDPELRSRVLDVMHFDRDRVGRIMDFKMVTVRADVTLATVQRFLRSKKTIPEGTDKLFVTGKNNKLLGELPLTEILLNTPEKQVSDVMNTKPTTFLIDDKAEDAAGAFERYNLISAAVIDAKGKLMGRVTIEDVIDLVNEENDSNIRKMGGVNPEEDVFAPVRKSVRTRWAWLAINLCTAFIASR
ncbi:MAG TPA: magnesium transporter, partial [Erwinia persicina]|nr:magnesium transporter [Erwinia persicina]